jgi:1-acyl-sn-glycerol-3-phosphate acyltransferase
MFAPARHPIRFLWRAAKLIGVFVTMTVVFVAKMGVKGRRLTRAERTDWVHCFSRHLLWALAVRVALRGQPPATGMIVSNHLSYLDIPVLASVRPAVFVAKADVSRWPVLGWYTRLAGTLYVERERRRDVSRMQAAMSQVLDERHVLLFFPEGTSSGGETVLPFRSSLLEPVARQSFPVTPVALSYALDDGKAAEEVCYWGDMTLFPHLLNLLTKREIRVAVAFGEPHVHDADRKELARRLHAEVLALKNSHPRDASTENHHL